MASIHVIAGGLGNVGRHMQRALLAQGKRVRVIDLDCANPSVEAFVDFVPHKLGYDAQERLVDSLQGVETVYTLYSPDVQHGTVEQFKRVNVHGTQQLIAACQQAGVSKFVHGSSIAVTDHFQHSINQNEDHPLPPMDSYVSWYDKSKRMGEDCVLAANSDGGMQTCSLRLGGVISGMNDYIFRHALEASPGNVITVQSEPIDHISAKDVCRAMILAGNRLHESSTIGLSGDALFVSENAGGRVHPHDVSKYFARRMNWRYICIPKSTTSYISEAVKLFGHVKAWSSGSDPQDLLGVPNHLFLRVPLYEQTFDNSKAHKVLGFEPRYSWHQSVDEVVDEYLKLRMVFDKQN